MKSKQYFDFLSYVYRNSALIKRFCSESEQLTFNNSSKILIKIPPKMQNFGQLGPMNWFFWHGFFFSLIACSKFALKVFIILHDFSFKNTNLSASERVHPLRLPLFVHGADSPQNHPPSVEDERTALCSFSEIAVVKCLVDDLQNSLYLQYFFPFIMHV